MGLSCAVVSCFSLPVYLISMSALLFVHHTASALQPTRFASLSRLSVKTVYHGNTHAKSCALFSSSSSSSSSTTLESSCQAYAANHISRKDLLVTLLQKYGAPGSIDCKQANGDIQGISLPNSVSASLHPYLYPLAQSTSSGHVICAYMSPDSKTWPIIETVENGKGMHVLALNSEYMMKRIACEQDYKSGDDTEAVDSYNASMDQVMSTTEATLKAPFATGMTRQSKLSLDKTILLKVGPFLDLYQQMSLQHWERGDVTSSLIAAETANGKFSGLAAPYYAYAKLLSQMSNRLDETRDAARMCWRLPLATLGLNIGDALQDILQWSRMTSSDKSASTQDMLDWYETVQAADRDDDSKKSPEEKTMQEVTSLLDKSVLESRDWKEVRPIVSQKLRSIGKTEIADIIDLCSQVDNVSIN
jgi:hypothetical protein